MGRFRVTRCRFKEVNSKGFRIFVRLCYPIQASRGGIIILSRNAKRYVRVYNRGSRFFYPIIGYFLIEVGTNRATFHTGRGVFIDI